MGRAVARDRGALRRGPADGHPGLEAHAWRERVVVIDRKTKDIIWQYGVTDRKGYAPDYLNYPDGFHIDVFHDWKGALGTKP